MVIPVPDTIVPANHNKGVNAHPCFVYGSLMDARVRDTVTKSGPDAKLFVAKASIKVLERGSIFSFDILSLCLQIPPTYKIMKKMVACPAITQNLGFQQLTHSFFFPFVYLSFLAQGYVRYPYYNQPFPGMIASEDPEATVDGLLIFGYSDQDRYRLDQFEGAEYPRSTLTVSTLEPVPAEWTLLKDYPGQEPREDYTVGTTLQAYVYTFTGPLVHLDRTRPWDFAEFKKNHLDNWVTKSAGFATMVGRTTE